MVLGGTQRFWGRGGGGWDGESILLNDKPNTWCEGDYESIFGVGLFFPLEKYFKEHIVLFFSA